MKQKMTLSPISHQTHWVLNLKINQEANRIQSCFRKIERLMVVSRQGEVSAILTIYEWYRSLRQVEGYFDKEIKRLSKLIKRKAKSRIDCVPVNKQSYRLPVSSPLSFILYNLICKFDRLMCLSKTCRTLLIFKKRRLLSKKYHVYKTAFMRAIMQISQYSDKQSNKAIELNKQTKTILMLAIQSEMLPIMPKKVLHELAATVKSTSHEVMSQQQETQS